MKINVYVIKNIIEFAVTYVSIYNLNLSSLKINQREQTRKKSYSMHVFPNLFDSLYAAEEYRLKQNFFLKNVTSSYIHSYIIPL